MINFKKLSILKKIFSMCLLLYLTIALAEDVKTQNSTTTISPIEKNRDPFQEQSNNNKQELELKNMYSILFFIHYGNAENIVKLLIDKSNNFLSPTGIVTADKRTNSIWVQDTQENLDKINKFIKQVDIPVKQVLIEARIVNVDDNFIRDMGNEFGTASSSSSNDSDSGLNMDLPSQSMAPGHFGFTILKINNGVLIDMELTALESEGRAKIISRPQLVTLNREEAYIEAGDEIPYQEKTSEGDTSVSFKKAVLGLKVTPEIVSENKILLKITLNQDKVSQMMVQKEPAISTRKIATQVLVNDKQTVVLGGIYEENKEAVTERIPFLGSIPLVGSVFSYKHTANERKELLIFITPKIIN